MDTRKHTRKETTIDQITVKDHNTNTGIKNTRNQDAKPAREKD